MSRKTTKGEIYHVLNRGVDKRNIFLDNKDYLRFIHDLFEFNDTEPVNNLTYFMRNQSKSKDIASPYIEERERKRRPRKLLVEILCFCLMPNHYHLMLKPVVEDGISLFMKKLNIGYAKYFNEKYKRTGTLFEGRYKLILIDNQAHFVYLPYYIHLNPLDLIMPEWREKKLSDYQKAMAFLEDYRWSSFLDYIGRKNFPSITSRDFLLEIFKTPDNYKKETKEWLKGLNLDSLQGLTLEDQTLI